MPVRRRGGGGGGGGGGTPGATEDFDIDGLSELDERPAEDDYVGVRDTSASDQKKVTAQHLREGVFSLESIEQNDVPELGPENVGWVWKIGPNLMECYADSLDGTELDVDYENYSHTNYRGAHYGYAAVANPDNDDYFLNLLDGHIWVYISGTGEPDGWHQMSSSQAHTLGYLGYVANQDQADQLVAHSSGTKVGKLVAWGVIMRRVTSFTEEQTTHTVYRLREYVSHTADNDQDNAEIIGEDILAYSGDLPTTSFPNGDVTDGDDVAWTLGSDAPSDWEVTAGNASNPSTVGIPVLAPDGVDGLWIESVVDGTLVDRKKLVWGPSGSGYLSTGSSQGRSATRVSTSATQYLHVVWYGDEYITDDTDELRTRLVLGFGSSTQPSDTIIRVRWSFVRGARGRQGQRGLQGVQGVQGRFRVRIYRNSTSALTVAPTGGTYDLDDGTLTAPSDWSTVRSSPGAGETTYESIATINPAQATGDITPAWSVPYEFGADLSNATIDARIASYARATPTGTIADAQIPASIMRDSEFTAAAVRNLLGLDATEVDDLLTGATISNGVLTFTQNDGTDVTINIPEGADGVVESGSISADGETLTLSLSEGDDIEISIPDILRSQSGLPTGNAFRSGNTIQVNISGESSEAGFAMIITTPNNAEDLGNNPLLRLNSESARQLRSPNNQNILAGQVPNYAYVLVVWSTSNYWQILSWPMLTRTQLLAGSSDRAGALSPVDLRAAIDDRLSNYSVLDSQIPASIMRDSEFTAAAVQNLLGLDATEVNDLLTGASLSAGVLTFTQNDGTDVTITLPEGSGGEADGVVESGSISDDGETLTLSLSEGDDVEIDIPAILRTGTGLDSALSNLDDDLTVAEQRAILVKLGELNNAYGGLPQPSADWLGRTWINWQTGVEYLCINDPDKSSISTGTFTEVTRDDLQISGGFPTPVLDDYLINTVDWSFWTGVNIRSGVVGWVQDGPTDTLFGSIETGRETVHWMGAYPSDEAALDDLHALADNTTYFYGNTHDGKVYRLTASSFTDAGDLRNHYKWIIVGGNLKFIDARTGLPTLDQDGQDDTTIALGPDGDFFSVELDVHQATPNTFTGADYTNTRFVGEQNSAWFIDNPPTETQFTNRYFGFNKETEQWLYIVQYASPFQGQWVGGQLPDTHHGYRGAYDDADDAASHLIRADDLYYDRELEKIREATGFSAGTTRYFSRSWRRVGRSDTEVLRVIVEQIGDLSVDDKATVREGLDITYGFASSVIGTADGPFSWTSANSERWIATGITIPDDLGDEEWVVIRFNHGQYHWIHGDEFNVDTDVAGGAADDAERIASYIETFGNVVAVAAYGKTTSNELLVAVRVISTTATLTVENLEVRRITETDLIQTFVAGLDTVTDEERAAIQEELGLGPLMTTLETTIAADASFTTNSLRGTGYTLPDEDDVEWMMIQIGSGEYRFIRRDDFSSATAASEGDVVTSANAESAYEAQTQIASNLHVVNFGRTSDDELLIQVLASASTIELPAVRVYSLASGDSDGGQQSPGLSAHGDDFVTVTHWINQPDGVTPDDPTRRWRWEDGFTTEDNQWYLSKTDAENTPGTVLWVARQQTRREVDIEGDATYTDYAIEKYALWDDQYTPDEGTTIHDDFEAGDTQMRTRKADGSYTPWWLISADAADNPWEHLASGEPWSGNSSGNAGIDFNHDPSDFIAIRFVMHSYAGTGDNDAVIEPSPLAVGIMYRPGLWGVSSSDTNNPPDDQDQHYALFDIQDNQPQLLLGHKRSGRVVFNGGTHQDITWTDSEGDFRRLATRTWFTWHFVSSDGTQANVNKIRAYDFARAWHRLKLEVYGLRG